MITIWKSDCCKCEVAYDENLDLIDTESIQINDGNFKNKKCKYHKNTEDKDLIYSMIGLCKTFNGMLPENLNEQEKDTIQLLKKKSKDESVIIHDT